MTEDSRRLLKPNRLLIMIPAGIVIMVMGFIYDSRFAGIPYQDPTLEMSARYAGHAHIASTIGEVGIAVFIIGILAQIIRRLVRSEMGLVLKWAVATLLLGIFLPAEPSSFRGDGTPVGMNPGAILLISAGYTAVAGIDVYYQNRNEPSYGPDHLFEDTVIPVLKGLSVVLALLLVCLVVFVPRLRTSRFRMIAAFFILLGGLCLILKLYPGYPPLFNNGYMYYPGAYFLMVAFPMIALSLFLKPTKASTLVI